MKSCVFISGACGGLGRNFAAECALRGWDLFLTDLREDKLTNIADALSCAYGISADWCACDMADERSRTNLIEEMNKRGLRFHMALNVAGVDYEGFFLEKSRGEILSMLNINAVSTVDMMHSLTKLRDTEQRFCIINVCSLAGMFPMPVKATYAATKRLLIDMTLALREEFRSINATVTALCPAGMATTEAMFKSLDVQGLIGRITTLEVGYITSRTIELALKGKAVYIPGILNRVLHYTSKFLPPALVAYLIGRRWSRTNRALEVQEIT
jgi:uncharacterized protein